MKRRKISCSAKLDDEAYDIAKTIKTMDQVCDTLFEQLLVKCEEKKWVVGLESQELNDWLHEYCFNSEAKNMFSEHLPDTWDVQYSMTFDQQEDESQVSETDSTGTVEIDKGKMFSYEKKVEVQSRYNAPRYFYYADKEWYYDTCEDECVGVGVSLYGNRDGSLGHVDPSGGPFVGVGDCLKWIHKELPSLTVDKIEQCASSGLFKLTTSTTQKQRQVLLGVPAHRKTMSNQNTLRILERLANAGEVYVADQSRATDSNCGLVQPISVEEGIELCHALKEAWAHIKDREQEISLNNEHDRACSTEFFHSGNDREDATSLLDSAIDLVEIWDVTDSQYNQRLKRCWMKRAQELGANLSW